MTAPPPPLPTRLWILPWVALATLLLLPAVALLAAQRFGWLEPQLSPERMVQVGLLLYGTGAVLVAALALRWPPLSWGPPRVLAVLRIYLPAALVWLLLVIGYLRAMHACGRPVAPQPELLQVAASGVATPGFWVAALVIVVAAPLAEEIVFRGYLLGFLLMVMPRWPAQLAAAAAFGWVHGIDYMLPIALLGLLFGWLRERYGAMWPSVVAHMLHNGLTLTLAVAWPRFLEQLFPR